jgi:hypothetical protein
MISRGRKPDPYTTWLCWYLACTVTTEDTGFLPQHKWPKGAYAIAARRLQMTPEAVEYHVRKARKRRETKEGLADYHQWLNQRERHWWWSYHHTVTVTALGVRDGQDYKEWLTVYERRDENGRSRPLVYRPMAADAAIAMDEARAAKGLRNGLSSRGRPRIN